MMCYLSYRKEEREVKDIWLGLTKDELIELYNDSIEHFGKERQQEVKARASEWPKLAVFPGNMPVDFAIMVQFVINAIRLNNQRIQEQLEVKPTQGSNPPS